MPLRGVRSKSFAAAGGCGLREENPVQTESRSQISSMSEIFWCIYALALIAP